jgi:hypothetical protein
MNGVTLPSYASNAYLYGPALAAAPAAAPATISPFSVLLAQSPLPQPSAPPQSALDALANISAGGTSNDSPYGGPGPQGEPGTGNPLTDIPEALSAFGNAIGGPVGSLGGPVAGGLATLSALSPANLPGFVAGTMLGQVPGVYGSVPAKGPGALGTTGGLHGLKQLARDIYNSIVGYPQKTEAFAVEGGPKGPAQPEALTPEEAAAQAVQAAITGDVGGPKGATEKSAPDDGWGDVSAESTSGGVDGGSKGETSSDFRRGGMVNYAQGGTVLELQGGGKIAVGPGGGLDDLIPTSINGRRAAALSDGEFVVPADVVSMMGDGSSNAGARRLYDLVRQIREAKTGTSRQAGPLPVGEILKRTMR